jgi:hypothetical protein
MYTHSLLSLVLETFLQEETLPETEREPPVVMSYRTADHHATNLTLQIGEIFRLLDCSIVLKSFKKLRRQDAIKVATLQLTVAILLVHKYFILTLCTSYGHDEGLSSSRLTIPIIL